MKALLLRLSTIDSETEAALRVIAYFDALAMRSATAEMVVRGAAAVSEATAGLTLPDGGVLRFDASGAQVPGRPPNGSFVEHSVSGIRAWIEREEGARRPLDDLICERFALTAKSASSERAPRMHSELADPALFELILSAREPLAERSVALRRLGLTPGAPVVLIAVTVDCPDQANREYMQALVARVSSLTRARGARLGSYGVIIAQSRVGAGVAAEAHALRQALAAPETGGSLAFRCGISTPVDALDAAAGWESARSVLRFARPRSHAPSIVTASELGTVEALASVTADVWTADWRVRALREISLSDSGRIDMDVLEAYLLHGSLRMAGQALHMHHSSIASRLARLEERLALDFAVQADLFHAWVAFYAATLVPPD